MMYNGTLSYKSPLYGRRIGEWNLKPLNFKELTGFFPGMNIEKAIELYSIFGNIPAYLDKIDTSKTVKENILNVLMRKGSGLYREPEFLLKEELREPSRYISIFEALGSSAKLSEIASKSRVIIYMVYCLYYLPQRAQRAQRGDALWSLCALWL